MRYLISWAAAMTLLLALSATLVTGQGPGAASKKTEPKTPAAPPSQSTPDDGVARISPTQARDLMEKGKAVIIDVRTVESYRIGHIKGALWMPDIAARVKELPRDKMIVTYCS